MHIELDAHQRGAEYRRYFPDWTERPLRIGEELEADHNSYLAGGYVEEFGHLAHDEASRGITVIGGSPDDDAWRLVQWGACVHPGYPLKPHPVSADWEETARSLGPARSPGGAAHVGRYGTGHEGTFFRVTERPYEQEHRQPARRLAVALTRVRAALVALRRQLPSGR